MKHREGETVRMIRIPPADRADQTDTEEIEEIDVGKDHWAEATGRVSDDRNEFVELRSEGDEIKQRHLAYMTAFCLWFMLVSVAGIIAAFVIRVIASILGV